MDASRDATACVRGGLSAPSCLIETVQREFVPHLTMSGVWGSFMEDRMEERVRTFQLDGEERGR